MINEKWIPVKGFENRLSVNKNGNIKSLARKWSNGLGWEIGIKDRILKTGALKAGYRYISLKINSERKNILVHRIVATAFIPNPENKPNVNHKNGVKSDNRVENLEWCTQSENVLHSYRNGFQKGKGVKNEKHPKSKPIICVEENTVFPCAQEAGRFYKTNPSHISAVCRGERGKAIGRTFKFIAC